MRAAAALQPAPRLPATRSDGPAPRTRRGRRQARAAGGPEALRLLSAHAMTDIAHLLRPGHLQQLANILADPEPSSNDRFVALGLAFLTLAAHEERTMSVSATRGTPRPVLLSGVA